MVGRPAARVTDMHMCSMTPIPPGLPIIPPTSMNVMTCGLPQARVTDRAACVGPPPANIDAIVMGSPTVYVNNLMAARMGDPTAKGGLITTGCFTVLIGDFAVVAPPVVTPGGMPGMPGGGMPGMPGGAGGIGGAIGAAAGAAAGAAGAAAAAAAGAASAAGAAAAAAAAAMLPDVTTGLGADVDKIVNMSPTLKGKIDRLQKAGYDIETQNGGGTYCDKDNKKIVVDTSETTEQQVQSLSHETGHADYTADPYVPPDGLSKEDYVKANLNTELKDEGEAMLTEIEVRDEIKAAGGPEIPLSGNSDNHSKYEKAYEDFKKSGDREQARQDIGDIFADGEKTSTTDESYRDYYSGFYEDEYDKHSSGSP